MASSRRSRSEGSWRRLQETSESETLAGRGLVRASSVSAASGGSYFVARAVSSCTVA